MGLDFVGLETHSSSVAMSPKGHPNVALSPCLSFKEWQTGKNKQESFKMRMSDADLFDAIGPSFAEDDSLLRSGCFQAELASPGSNMELNAAALKVQKVYKSYRTRRNLADCAVVVEELWWRALDYASLNVSSVSFFDAGKSQSTAARWTRAGRKAAKVGKGLSKDAKAQKLALRHWLEAIDPRHRYGHNLSMYYDIWFKSESTQPFFYWLDIGDGKELVLERCPRHILHRQCIQYLGPKEREAYEVVVRSGKLTYKKSEQLLNTTKGFKWIFVLSTCRTLYVGKKIKGQFQHSSFLAGAATTAAGRMVVNDGILQAIWPYSGHYLPTEANFMEFINYLLENSVDLTDVKRDAVDEDDYSFADTHNHSVITSSNGSVSVTTEAQAIETSLTARSKSSDLSTESGCFEENSLVGTDTPRFQSKNDRRSKWSTGVGPRIGCVRDYPTDLQVKALEQVSLSPRNPTTPTTNKVPIPSPRPSPTLRLSPRIACMGVPSSIQSPRFGHFIVPTSGITLTLPNLKKR